MPARDDSASAEQQGETAAAANATRGRALDGLPEPWWLIAIERLATDRWIQLGIGAGLAVIIALVVFWPRSETGISLSELKRYPERFEGQSIRIQGRVGDVFAVGQGHAFHLHQGRDTVVVYTRTRIPAAREKVSVVGSVSTGYLDGIARIAVFETP
ncbi:MAG TPA: hypothetical protein VEY91_06725 [Candidatus Limnocylindria bacterium]|nr:hypothetical protein [Candidatus Limnocylindria bacterium]